MIRLYEEKDEKEVRDLWTSHYGAYFTQHSLRQFLDEGRIYVSEENGVFTGCIAWHTRAIILNGKLLRSSYILPPLCVYEGGERKLLEPVLDMLSHLELFSVCESDALFREYGFEEVYPRRYASITSCRKDMCEGEIVTDASSEELRKAYAGFVSHFEGAVFREEKDMRERLSFYTGCGHKVMAVRNGEDIYAYALYREKEEKIEIEELVYLDGKSLAFLISTLMEGKKEIEADISVRENLSFLGEVSYRDKSGRMVKIHDKDLFNKLYKTSVQNATEAYSLSRRPPLYFEEW